MTTSFDAQKAHPGHAKSARRVVEDWAASLTWNAAPQEQNMHLSWVREEKVKELISALEKAGYK